MKKNWMYGSVMAALLALLVSGCGDSQRTLEFRGICVDDLHGENGLYNPGRGFRLETAVDVLHEKDRPTTELLELSEKYVADSVSLAQSYFYLMSGTLWGEPPSVLPGNRFWNIWTS